MYTQIFKLYGELFFIATPSIRPSLHNFILNLFSVDNHNDSWFPDLYSQCPGLRESENIRGKYYLCNFMLGNIYKIISPFLRYSVYKGDEDEVLLHSVSSNTKKVLLWGICHLSRIFNEVRKGNLLSLISLIYGIIYLINT